MIIELFPLLILNCFAIYGFHVATREGMILQKIQLWTPAKLSMPVHDCPVCMASIHSIYVFLLWHLQVEPTAYWWYPVYILSLAGINKVFIDFVIREEEDETTKPEQ